MNIVKFLDVLPESIREQVSRRLSNMSRFARIGYTLQKLDVENKVVVFQLQQIDRLTEKIYDHLEMNKFFREHLDILDQAGWTVHLNFVDYEVTGYDYITAAWIKEQMAIYRLKQSDLAKDFNIDKQAISRMLNEAYGMTRWHKALFYFYFKAKEKWAYGSYGVGYPGAPGYKGNLAARTGPKDDLLPVRTYDVVFHDSENSNSKGFSLPKQEAIDWVNSNNGSKQSYFADYVGGIVQVVCNETGDVVYETEVLPF